MRIFKQTLIALSLLTLLTWATVAKACPFCSVVSQTLSQEIAGNDVAVIARLIKLPKEISLDDMSNLDLDDLDSESGLAEFEVLETIRGDASPAAGSIIKVVFFGNGEKKLFLVNGLIKEEKTDWTTPLAISERGRKYIKQLGSLPEKGPDRIHFFMGHLEDTDPLLAQDAYDEFARAPYEVITALAERMNRPQLLRWIEDAEVGPTRRRLYLTMLGVCGKEEDTKILESLLRYDYYVIKPSLVATFHIANALGPIYGITTLNEMVKADGRRKQQCLDALIAAYLKLKGVDGLKLIEARFLSNPNVEYSHVYAAVMALRFHCDDIHALPRERIIKSVRLLLSNPDIADQVITDLTRWEDWSVMDQLVTMFKASEQDSWIRQPIVSYLITAVDQPTEVSMRANQALEELEKVAPKDL